MSNNIPLSQHLGMIESYDLEIAALTAERDSLTKQGSELAFKLFDANVEINELTAERDRLKAECAGYVASFHKMQNDLSVLELRDAAQLDYIARLEEELERTRARLREEMYKSPTIYTEQAVEAKLERLRHASHSEQQPANVNNGKQKTGADDV